MNYAVNSNGAVCELGGSLDFTTASAVLEEVSSLVKAAADGQLTIDMHGVESSNSAGLALMVEWLAVAKAAGCELSFTNVPKPLEQLSDVCEVDSLI